MKTVIYWLVFFTSLRAAWKEDVDAGFAEAKKEGSALVVAFVGSRWCPWSEKVEREVLSDPLFEEGLGPQFICVKVDVGSENRGVLATEYRIEQVPTFLRLEQNQQEIARVGFLPQSAKEFGAHLASLYDKYASLQERLSHKNIKTMDPEELKHLYLFASSQGFKRLQDLFFEEGLKRNQGTFFLLEKYRQLFSSRKDEAKEVRKEIVARDPKNVEGSWMHLAVFDFLDKQAEKNSPEKVIKPLKKYLKKQGQTHPDHVWRLEMMISQHLYHRGKKKQAKKAAEKALKVAPLEMQEEIQEWVKSMQEST